MKDGRNTTSEPKPVNELYDRARNSRYLIGIPILLLATGLEYAAILHVAEGIPLMFGALVGMLTIYLIPLPARAENPVINPENDTADDWDSEFWVDFGTYFVMANRDEEWRKYLPKWSRGGYVYVIRDIEISGFCKIGRTNEPASRIGHFDTMLPFRTHVIHIIPCADCIRTEAVLHRRFADKRKRGEWFALADEDIQWIEQIQQA